MSTANASKMRHQSVIQVSPNVGGLKPPRRNSFTGSSSSSSATSPASSPTPANAPSIPVQPAAAAGHPPAGAPAAPASTGPAPMPGSSKAKRLAREAAEAQAKAEANELHSLRSYNEMLKQLLSKEIATREAAEEQVAFVNQQFEHFKEKELESLRANHQAHINALEGNLYAKFQAAHEGNIEAIVAERVEKIRANDVIKIRDIGELQSKLQLEFEDKYSQRFQRMEREKKELLEKLNHSLVKVDSLAAETKTATSKFEQREDVLRALEHRCHALEGLKSNLHSFRNLVKFMSCRVFVNSVRLKKHLGSVYESLRVLHVKLNENFDYDRRSEVILPQHELEAWLDKTQGILSRAKPLSTANTTGGGSGSNQFQFGNSAEYAHPNTILSTPSLKPLVPSSPAPPSLPNASPTSPNSALGKFNSPLPKSLHPSSAQTQANATGSASPVPVTPNPGTSRRNKRAMSISKNASKIKPKIVLDPDDPNQTFTSSRHTALGFSLNFRDMLQAISEVEIVLRGCLIECLNKTHEWKTSSEDFFERNQELVTDNMTLKETTKKQEVEIKSLQSSMALLEKTLNEIQNDRKAIREIESQAPKATVMQTRMLSAGVTKRLTAYSSAQASREQNGLDRELVSRHAEPSTGKNEGLVDTSQSTLVHSMQQGDSGGLDIEQQTKHLIAQHHRINRLSALDGTNPSEIEALNAEDFRELVKPNRKGIKVSGARGFFDHHSALVQVCMTQKDQLSILRSNEEVLKKRIDKLKGRIEELKERQKDEWKVATQMDEQVEEAEEREAKENAEDGNEAANNNAGGADTHSTNETGSRPSLETEEKEQRSRSHSPSKSSSGGRNSSSRPQQLKLGDNYADPKIRTSIPFSPPVFPVSPYQPQRPHSSHSHARPHSSSSTHSSGSRGGTPGSYPIHHQFPQSALRGPALSVSVPGEIKNRTGTNAHQEERSPYSSLPSRSQSSASAPQSRLPSRGGDPLLSQTQPINTSSASYAGTTVYAPSLALFTPGPHAHQYLSTRGAERVYGMGFDNGSNNGGSRPRTSGSLSARTAPRTVTPLMAAGLASSSTVAAAIQAHKGQLHPSLQLTGDVRYDIISPYVAQPLPWEKKDDHRRAPSPKRFELPPPPPVEKPPKKPRVPRQQTRSKDASKGISEEMREEQRKQAEFEAQQEREAAAKAAELAEKERPLNRPPPIPNAQLSYAAVGDLSIHSPLSRKRGLFAKDEPTSPSQEQQSQQQQPTAASLIQQSIVAAKSPSPATRSANSSRHNSRPGSSHGLQPLPTSASLSSSQHQSRNETPTGTVNHSKSPIYPPPATSPSSSHPSPPPARPTAPSPQSDFLDDTQFAARGDEELRVHARKKSSQDELAVIDYEHQHHSYDSSQPFPPSSISAPPQGFPHRVSIDQQSAGGEYEIEHATVAEHYGEEDDEDDLANFQSPDQRPADSEMQRRLHQLDEDEYEEEYEVDEE